MVALFWGGTFIAGRVLAQAMPLQVAAFGRFFVAALLLVWVAFHFEGGLPRLNRTQLLITVAMGLTGIFLYNMCFFGALARIPAGRTALFVSLTPIVTALMARLTLREGLGSKRWGGIGVALIGALIVITRGDLTRVMRNIGESIGLGEILMSLAVLNWAMYTLISRKAAETMSSIAATTYAALWGLTFLSVGAVGELSAVDWLALGWQVWVSLLYLGAIGTVVAFIWYNQGIRSIGPSRTAVFTNLVPAFGVLLSAVLLGEEVLASMLIGGVVSVAGVFLVNKK
ncbi:DMT family transporter [Uliginosibacterium sp. TH139]|uniref:DMT family transporter n=1 Tax=Uliginosibacterium sp. TH139 TaxID=2067453 RepID=UPI001C1FC7B4|nr:DMT family transporter [Uliginosibacterium sp. TH139]